MKIDDIFTINEFDNGYINRLSSKGRERMNNTDNNNQ